ncbi:DUF6176 family protein [uncultured Citricoccus sp.]|uniref:DUF6176 family protein n=1 Tax=uncultured Citricoccus sp. TaxID=614031 RepID=UPI002625B0C2|nr:DUF6176 family protein [uncultured Citricoccus sp.]
MIFSLTRFRLRPGSRALADEWVRFMEAHRCAVGEIMKREHMYVEAIFTETVNGADYLYWYSLQDDHDRSAEPFDHWFDEHHTRFWQACIDDTFPVDEFTPQILLTTEGIRAAAGLGSRESVLATMDPRGDGVGTARQYAGSEVS